MIDTRRIATWSDPQIPDKIVKFIWYSQQHTLRMAFKNLKGAL